MLRSANPSTQTSQLQANATMAAITIPTASPPSSPITFNRLGCILAITRHRHGHCRVRTFPVLCSSSGSNSKPRRGFGPPPSNEKRANKVTTSGDQQAMLERRKLSTKQSGTVNTIGCDYDVTKVMLVISGVMTLAMQGAPALNLRTDGKSNSASTDLQFEERLEAVKRSTLEHKKFDQSKEYGAIDYDAPVESDPITIGLGTKIGIGVAVVAFGLVFALGDFLPTTSDTSTDEAAVVRNKLSEEEKQTLQTRLQQYEATLAASPDDPTALEGAAVTLTELGDYTRAASMLEDLAKKKSNDPYVFRLLGEAKYELRDYDGSAAAYKRSAMVSKTVNFEALRGLTNALLAAKRPDEAVQVLLASRERLNTEKSNDHGTSADESTYQLVDPIQVEMLLGKAYSDWGHISDAVSVYDQLISSHPDDFRGYLAKGIILKENGRVGEAERMFIQARFFAPENAKALVDRYSRR